MDGADRLFKVSTRMAHIAHENPCRWSDSVMGGIATALELMLGEKTRNGVTLMELADYYGVSLRTIERWRALYDDFPQPIDPYAKTISFPTDAVVEWKEKHKDRF